MVWLYHNTRSTVISPEHITCRSVKSPMPRSAFIFCMPAQCMGFQAYAQDFGLQSSPKGLSPHPHPKILQDLQASNLVRHCPSALNYNLTHPDPELAASFETSPTGKKAVRETHTHTQKGGNREQARRCLNTPTPLVIPGSQGALAKLLETSRKSRIPRLITSTINSVVKANTQANPQLPVADCATHLAVAIGV